MASLSRSYASTDCPWEGTERDTVMLQDDFICWDGTSCNGEVDGYDCCGCRGGRALCPLSIPFMCNDTSCGAGTAWCCQATRCDRPVVSASRVFPALGPRPCPSRHPAGYPERCAPPPPPSPPFGPPPPPLPATPPPLPLSPPELPPPFHLAQFFHPLAGAAALLVVTVMCAMLACIARVARALWLAGARRRLVKQLAAQDTAIKMAIQRLPVQVFDGSSRDSECAICLNTFSSGERLRVLPCRHTFHCACIDGWLLPRRAPGSLSQLRIPTCPLCKGVPLLSDELEAISRAAASEGIPRAGERGQRSGWRGGWRVRPSATPTGRTVAPRQQPRVPDELVEL